MKRRKVVDGSENEEGRLRREHMRALIERLNANDEYLQGIEGRRRDGQLLTEELELELERERNRNLRGADGMGPAGG